MSYDSKCFDLAEAFLSDTHPEFQAKSGDTMDLAQVIQTAIEDWFAITALERRPSFDKQIEGLDYFRERGRPGDDADC